MYELEIHFINRTRLSVIRNILKVQRMCIYTFVLDLEVKIWVMIHFKYNIISLILIPRNFYQERTGIGSHDFMLGKMGTWYVSFHSKFKGKQYLFKI